MNIAIIGAGFSGLSVAYFLTRHPGAQVTIYDELDIGRGASGVAAGLVHPYAGKRANLSHFGNEAFSESCRLIAEMDTLSRSIFRKSIILQQGILRPAITQQQEKDFKARSEKDNVFAAQFLSPQESSQFYPNPLHLPSLYIPEGLAIDSLQYLNTLFHASQSQGAIFKKERVKDLSALTRSYDAAVLSCGYQTNDLLGCRLVTNRVKGQKVEKKLPSHFLSPVCAISGAAYAAFLKGSVCLGSTYERGFSSLDPEIEHAEREIGKKIDNFWPQLMDFPTIEVQAGVRATTPTSHPIVAFQAPNIWAITGMGSKGLLYHAFLGKAVAYALLHQTPEHAMTLLTKAIFHAL